MDTTVLVDASDELHDASRFASDSVGEQLSEQATHMAEHASEEEPNPEALQRQHERLGELSKQSRDDDVRGLIESAREKVARFLED